MIRMVVLRYECVLANMVQTVHQNKQNLLTDWSLGHKSIITPKSNHSSNRHRAQEQMSLCVLAKGEHRLYNLQLRRPGSCTTVAVPGKQVHLVFSVFGELGAEVPQRLRKQLYQPPSTMAALLLFILPKIVLGKKGHNH